MHGVRARPTDMHDCSDISEEDEETPDDDSDDHCIPKSYSHTANSTSQLHYITNFQRGLLVKTVRSTGKSASHDKSTDG